MQPQNSKCLVLNADYTPLTIIDWTKAIIWSLKYHENKSIGIEIIDFYKDDYILGINNKKHPIPAVAKTARYYRISNYRVKFSRKNLFIRDDHACQYCGKIYEPKELTYDHVIPKSLWSDKNGASPTSWTNIVTSCVHCNRKKGNKTPKQANMPLKNLPCMPQKHFKYLPITHHLLKIKSNIPEEWLTYLPESYI
jgi:5-methylcytosine-specific restriction endonuclease McrA